MRHWTPRVLVAITTIALLTSTSSTAFGQAPGSATLDDCPTETMFARGTEVTLDRESSVEGPGTVLCRYSNDTGSVKPNITIRWTDGGTLDPAGECAPEKLEPGTFEDFGDVIGHGIHWKSTTHEVETSWSGSIFDDDDDRSFERSLLVGLTRAMMAKSVGAPCGGGQATSTRPDTSGNGATAADTPPEHDATTIDVVPVDGDDDTSTVGLPADADAVLDALSLDRLLKDLIELPDVDASDDSVDSREPRTVCESTMVGLGASYTLAWDLACLLTDSKAAVPDDWNDVFDSNPDTLDFLLLVELIEKAILRTP